MYTLPFGGGVGCTVEPWPCVVPGSGASDVTGESEVGPWVGPSVVWPSVVASSVVASSVVASLVVWTTVEASVKYNVTEHKQSVIL